MEERETKEIRYAKAFKETYIIVNNFAEELYCKIPSKLIKFLKENMDKDYNVTLKEIEKNGEREETKAIM